MQKYPTFNLLLKAIEGWYDNAESRGQLEFGFSHTDFLKEFCTISLDLGRCSGKTSSIRAMLELYPDSYVISDDRTFKRHLSIPRLGSLTLPANSIVFVDEPYRLFMDRLIEDDFYQHMSTARAGLLVMLGKHG